MQNVFVDTDVTLDLLSLRHPFYIHSAKLFSSAEKGEIKIYVSSLSFSNLNYILTKQYTAFEAKKALIRFKQLVTILAVTEKEIEMVLNADFSDFEDAIQYYAATENNIQVLITRNLKDYKTATIAVMTAEQFLINT